MNTKSFRLLRTALIALLIIAVSYIVYKNYVHNQAVRNYFLKAKAQKTEIDLQTIKNLKTIIEDTNVREESRQQAAIKLAEVAGNTVLEREVEEKLYPYFKDEVLCYIGGNRCRIIAHGTGLGTSKVQLIKSIVSEVAHISEVEISLKS